MAFGISRDELENFKKRAQAGEVALITHYWYDERFPQYKTVTKAGCSDVSRLIEWGQQYGLKKEWIHYREGLPHFDLLGEDARRILKQEGRNSQLERFKGAFSPSS
ncbi:hypothetical protein [Alteribacter natronophilus]|uniref:hypothetical protein n=1 Tax=Alteribacter natronophilus TaxID=2583810 RepID=UPI00110F0387|nr:hypothetical protein [Alteribacter natronophilus]TMW73340.1 hypothetical protein FGB90_03250 [Alteribacter natronophilus]